MFLVNIRQGFESGARASKPALSDLELLKNKPNFVNDSKLLILTNKTSSLCKNPLFVPDTIQTDNIRSTTKLHSMLSFQ